MATVEQRNQEATVFVGNLDEEVTTELLWELFVQAGPVVSVHMPKDKVLGKHQGFGFVEFRSEDDAEYAIKIMGMVSLFGSSLRVNKAASDRKSADIGANLFIGGLDPAVDEKMLHDTFTAFGGLVDTPRVMFDELGNHRGFGFVKYDSFEAADAAIEAMNGQFLYNRVIQVQYALNKEGNGERHGSAAERLIAANQRALTKKAVSRPNTMFAGGGGGAAAGPGLGVGAGMAGAGAGAGVGAPPAMGGGMMAPMMGARGMPAPAMYGAGPRGPGPAGYNGPMGGPMMMGRPMMMMGGPRGPMGMPHGHMGPGMGGGGMGRGMPMGFPGGYGARPPAMYGGGGGMMGSGGGAPAPPPLPGSGGGGGGGGGVSGGAMPPPLPPALPGAAPAAAAPAAPPPPPPPPPT